MKTSPLTASYSRKDVDVKQDEVVWQHPHNVFSIHKLDCVLPVFDSDTQYQVQRTMIAKRPFVMVLPYDPELDQVVMIEQIRMANVFSRQQTPCLFELCAGYIEDGESPETAAKREVLEESGLRVQRLEKVCEYWVSPGWTSERAHFYCAHVDSKDAHGVFGVANEHESTKVHRVQASVFIDSVETGFLDNGGAVIGALWLANNRHRLRQEWAV